MASILRYFNELRTWSAIAIADVFSDTQTANSVFAGPTTGAAAPPTFRPLVAADLPLVINTDSAAKVWVIFDASGAILDSYNVTSVTKTGTGQFTVNFTTPFASANYACIVTGRQSSGANGWGEISHGTAPTASAVSVVFVTQVPATFDPDSGHVVCFGRQ